MPFNSFGLSPELLRGIKDLGFATPTAIQKDAIPAGINGKDVLACSMTGSGKTAAFMLPILNRLQAKNGCGVRALVVTPTRELAAQIDEHLRELGKYTRLKSATVYGGVGMGAQRNAIQRGVDILVATPGRLLDHLRQMTPFLGQVEVLVLDEADRMLDMGFLPDVRKILQYVPKQRQTLFFSATMPREIIQLTREMLQQPVSINLERQSKPAETITQTLYPVHQALKSSLLVKVLQVNNIRSALVFTRTKRRADKLAKYLKTAGVNAGIIHGDRSQSQRTHALEAFKRGRYQVLVATDVAARGIDVNSLSHVINFDLPGTTEDYIHRVGRTGRAEAKGDAFTFVTPEDEGAVRAIERVLPGRLPRVLIENFNYKDLPPKSERGDYGNDNESRGRFQRNKFKPQQRGGQSFGGQRRFGSGNGGNGNGGGDRNGRFAPRRDERPAANGNVRTERPERTERTDRTGPSTHTDRYPPKRSPNDRFQSRPRVEYVQADDYR